MTSLGPLVGKVKETQVEFIVDTLCANMVSGKEQLRDISSIGLKTVIGEMPGAAATSTSSSSSSTASPLAANICRRVTSKLTNTVVKSDDVTVQLEALEILGDLLAKFGGLLHSFHAAVQGALVPQLTSARMAVRKRAIIALSNNIR